MKKAYRFAILALLAFTIGCVQLYLAIKNQNKIWYGGVGTILTSIVFMVLAFSEFRKNDDVK